MYETEALHVHGSPMPVLLFEPETAGPHPGLVVAQHLPLAHTGLANDPFQLRVGERYAAAGYVCAMPFLFRRWPADADIAVNRAESRDDRTVDDLRATFDPLAGLPAEDAWQKAFEFLARALAHSPTDEARTGIRVQDAEVLQRPPPTSTKDPVT